MKRIISFALGTLWRWTNNSDTLINYARRLDVAGVEITFATKEELYSFHISEPNKLWLSSLDYLSIHAPFGLVTEAEDSADIMRQLNVISELSDSLNAKNVIIHPDELPHTKILKQYDFHISTENLPPKNRINISALRTILQSYPDIGLCIDVSHAYLWSKSETANLLKTFKKRITQVHMSGTYKKKDHQSMKNVTDEFLLSIEPVRELNVPVVIEEDIEKKDLGFIKREVEYIKNLLVQ